MKERDQIHRTYVNETDPTIKSIIFATYKKKRNHVVNIIKISKNKYYSDFFEENRSNSKKNLGRNSGYYQHFKKDTHDTKTNFTKRCNLH